MLCFYKGGCAARGLESDVEDVLEAPEYEPLRLVDGDLAAGELGERGDAAVGEAARDDGVEIGEVGRAVHREAMEGDPGVGHLHANRADLPVAGPHAGGFGVAAYDYLLAPVEEVMRREALEPMRSTVRLAKAELGTAAGLIGAAFVGFEALDAT